MNGAWLGVAGTVVGLIVGVLGYMRLIKSDSISSGQNLGTMTSELGYLKAGQEDLKQSFKSMERLMFDRHMDSNTRLSVMENTYKRVHERLDQLERMIKMLERMVADQV